MTQIVVAALPPTRIACVLKALLPISATLEEIAEAFPIDGLQQIAICTEVLQVSALVLGYGGADSEDWNPTDAFV